MDHRCGTRFPMSVAVELQPAHLPTAAGRLVMASVTGGLVETRLRFAPLTPVVLHHPQGADGIEAYVVRSTETGVALEWLEPASEAVLALLPARATSPFPLIVAPPATAGTAPL